MNTFWQDKFDRKEIRKAVDAAKKTVLAMESQELSPAEYINISYNAIHENESAFTRQDVVKVNEVKNMLILVGSADDKLKDMFAEYFPQYFEERG